MNHGTRAEIGDLIGLGEWLVSKLDRAVFLYQSFGSDEGLQPVSTKFDAKGQGNAFLKGSKRNFGELVTNIGGYDAISIPFD